MTPLQQLKSILNQRYVSEDGDEYKIELKAGLSDQQIDQFATNLPSKQIPAEIKDLLKFTSGFEFGSMEEITFNGVGQFGFEEIFPHSVQLAGDGFGNFWIVDVDNNGNWGNVFYACHDPAVIVKHSENLTEFIKHIDEFGRLGDESTLDNIHEEVVHDIWNSTAGGFIEKNELTNDPELKNFAAQIPDNFVITDLRNTPIKTGFAWGKYGPGTDKAVRYQDKLLWAFEKKKKKGLFSKLLGT